MSTDLKIKFIHNLNNRSQKGFTLVELLVVIIIIGILTAISIPNFLTQSAKAKQSEAQQNVAEVNKAQNIYRTQNNRFATTFNELAIAVLNGGANDSTANYDYTLVSANNDSATIIAQSKDTALKNYAGGNVRFTNTNSESVLGAVICEAVVPSTTVVEPPTIIGTTANCNAGYIKLGK